MKNKKKKKKKKKKKNMNNPILIRAEELQKECHKTVQEIKKNNPAISYQDATNTWIFLKLAELEIKQKRNGKSTLLRR